MSIEPAHDVAAEEKDLIGEFRKVDERLKNVIAPNEVVPVDAGFFAHPSAYIDRQTPFLGEVTQYRNLLAPQGREPQVQLPITKEDVELLKEKEYIATLRDFDRWVIQYLNGIPGDMPEKKEWLKQVYPEFFERQIETVNNLQDMQARFDKLQIAGPKSLEDLFFMFRFLQERQIRKSTSSAVDEAHLQGLYATADVGQMNAAADLAFQRGIFNTRAAALQRNLVWGLAQLPGHNQAVNGVTFAQATEQGGIRYTAAPGHPATPNQNVRGGNIGGFGHPTVNLQRGMQRVQEYENYLREQQELARRQQQAAVQQGGEGF